MFAGRVEGVGNTTQWHLAMRKAILMILLTVVSNSAAADWILAGRNATTNLYTDPATVRKAGNTVKMWELIDFNAAQVSTEGRPYMSSKSQSEYDCKEKRTRVLYFTLHSEHMGRGETVFTGSNPRYWIPVVPGSGSAGLREIACGNVTQ